jgi:hypothetical protein
MLATAPRAAFGFADPDTPRLRAANGAAHELIEEALRLSPTIRALLQQLDCTDVIAYVQLTGSPQVPTASTAFVASTPEARYLRIQINAGLPFWSRLQMLGHELQHALEIATEATVTSEEGMRALYLRIGSSNKDGVRFETAEARRIEGVIRGELASFGRGK